MSTAPSSSISCDDQKTYLDKILRSEVLRQAPSLVRFLEFVGRKVIDGRPHEIKEATIGAEAFGRAADFDPKLDAIVRVEAHRLREKLKEYYNREGADDEVRIDMPKGHYVPLFSRRKLPVEIENLSSDLPSPAAEAPESASSRRIAEVIPIQTASGSPRTTPVLRYGVAVAVLILLIGSAFLLHNLQNTAAKNASEPFPGLSAAEPQQPLRDLWADFLKEDSAPLATYTNDLYLETASRDLLRLKSQEAIHVGFSAGNHEAGKLLANPSLLERAGPLLFADSYTRTGETMGIFYLTRLFTKLDAPLGVMRSHLLTPAVLAQHNLIVLGSAIDNPLLARLPHNEDFIIIPAPDAASDAGTRIISNPRPLPGESSSYAVERDPATRALLTDYALVSFLPGLTPNRRIAALSGLTTLGTQAAAQFATGSVQAGGLAARLAPASHGKIPEHFQVVLKVQIHQDEILSVEYVAGHAIHPDPRARWYPN